MLYHPRRHWTLASFVPRPSSQHARALGIRFVAQELKNAFQKYQDALAKSIGANAEVLPRKAIQAAKCRIPDDHMAAYETAVDGTGAIPSWPASASCS